MTGFLYRSCEWIMRFAFLNLLWIVFTLLGFIIGGFFPSTIAMFTIIRKWIIGHSDLPVLHTFWTTYKKEWLKSNLLGVLLLAASSIIYLEYTVINNSTHSFLQLSKYPFFLLVILFTFLLLYSIPVYVHYNITILQVFKNSVLIMLINPLNNIVMILGLVLVYYIGQILPALPILFGGSVSAFIIMWTCIQSFKHIERKKDALATIKKEE
ncbi:YesL family protein [Sutcliffiella halmapala]|uniref:YesL family protein n=1 Tax=Sutcliffiella halmapala TaxID=79882 RepID=UPI001F23A4D7|nr:YesL family protein [Sutcliffiella halmapala]